MLAESSKVAQKSELAKADMDLNCEEGLPITLVHNSGLKIVMHLPEHMAECLIAEIKRPSRFSRSICAKFVDDEFVAIDMQEVGKSEVWAGLEIMVSGGSDIIPQKEKLESFFVNSI